MKGPWTYSVARLVNRPIRTRRDNNSAEMLRRPGSPRCWPSEPESGHMCSEPRLGLRLAPGCRLVKRAEFFS